jgi:hypothetical protein
MNNTRLTPKQKREILEKSLGNNPFSEDLVISVVRRPTGKFYEDQDGVKLPEESIQDIEPYTKVFISKDNRMIINNLSDKAKSMLLWLIQELESGKDYVFLPRKRYMEEMGISSITTVSNAISELTRYSFIAPSVVKNYYWVNPSFIFRGDRIRKYGFKFRQVK